MDTPSFGSVIPAGPADALDGAFSGHYFPARLNEVILTALRWYFTYAVSAQEVTELLADRGMDVSHRTILRWAQSFGPLLGQAVRGRLSFGPRWFVDEAFVRIGGLKEYLCRVLDEAGHVVGVFLRERRDTASADAFFRRAQERTAGLPKEIVSEYHKPRHPCHGNGRLLQFRVLLRDRTFSGPCMDAPPSP